METMLLNITRPNSTFNNLTSPLFNLTSPLYNMTFPDYLTSSEIAEMIHDNQAILATITTVICMLFVLSVVALIATDGWAALLRSLFCSMLGLGCLRLGTLFFGCCRKWPQVVMRQGSKIAENVRNLRQAEGRDDESTVHLMSDPATYSESNELLGMTDSDFTVVGQESDSDEEEEESDEHSNIEKDTKRD